MAAHTSPTRVVALDNLRVVAMLLGLVTHGVLPYTATGVIGFPIKDTTRHPLADACYFAVHDFRMQLFFMLAGFAAAAVAVRHGVRALVRNRVARVAGPLMLAAVVFCPALHVVFAGHAASRGVEWNPDDSGGWIGPNFHLWFLYYLLLCCVPLTALLAVGPRLPTGMVRRFDGWVRRFIASPWAVLWAAAVSVPVLWDMPAWLIDTPKGWIPDLTIYVYYLGFFLAGAALFRHSDLLPGVGRRWPLQVAVANLVILPMMLKMTVSGNWAEDAVRGATPAWLIAWKAAAILLGGLYTGLTISALLGVFQRYFTGNRPLWQYLAGASYWCYLAGFPVQALLQAGLAPYAMPILVEFVVVNGATFVVLLTGYEVGVRYTWVGWLLNGKRMTRPTDVPTVVVSGRLSTAGPVRGQTSDVARSAVAEAVPNRAAFTSPDLPPKGGGDRYRTACTPGLLGRGSFADQTPC